MAQDSSKNPPRVGLCEKCRFVRRIESDHGSTFYMCERSFTDASYPKYPRLPVLQCAGYVPTDNLLRFLLFKIMQDFLSGSGGTNSFSDTLWFHISHRWNPSVDEAHI